MIGEEESHRVVCVYIVRTVRALHLDTQSIFHSRSAYQVHIFRVSKVASLSPPFIHSLAFDRPFHPVRP